MVNKSRYMAPTRPNGFGRDSQNGLSIIILAATPGYRMRSYGPTPLLKDRYGLTILQNQSDIFKLFFPNSEIILVAGFEIDKIYKNKPDCVRLVENQLFESTGDGEEIRLGLNNSVHENVLITYGDIHFNEAFMRDFQNKESTMVLDSHESMLADDLGVTVVDEYATIMSFAIPTPKWCRLIFLTGKELKLLKQFAFDRSKNRMYLFEAINFILDKGGRIKVQYTQRSHEIVHVDNSKELDRIQK